jgi:N-acetylneuraminate lyase
MLAALPYGTEGAVGTTYNFNAELQYRVLDSWMRGEFAAARAAQLATTKFVAMFANLESQVDGAYILKIHMDLIGQPMGPGRLPYTKPTDAGRALWKTAALGWCNEFRAVAPSWCARIHA